METIPSGSVEQILKDSAIPMYISFLHTCTDEDTIVLNSVKKAAYRCPCVQYFIVLYGRLHAVGFYGISNPNVALCMHRSAVHKG